VTRDAGPRWAATRSRARDAALQMLYQGEIGKLSPALVRGVFWEVSESDDPPTETMRRFAEALAEGTTRALESIDPLIEAHSEHWRLARMPVIDRLILRLAVYEFLEQPDTPRPVVIDEAVELAKRYSTPEAGKFINGVLDAVRRRLEQDVPSSP
jgi:transcription antitermination protein NusB